MLRTEQLHPVHDTVVIVRTDSDGAEALPQYVGAMAVAGEPCGHDFIDASVSAGDIFALGVRGNRGPFCAVGTRVAEDSSGFNSPYVCSLTQFVAYAQRRKSVFCSFFIHLTDDFSLIVAELIADGCRRDGGGRRGRSKILIAAAAKTELGNRFTAAFAFCMHSIADENTGYCK